MKNYQITEWTHHFIELQVSEGDICIDATMGNGHDTALLSRLSGSSGKVYAFDIQPEALAHTEERLVQEACPENYELLLISHEKMGEYAEEGTVSCITFNLGYLPGGDHTKATGADTSIPAMESGLKLLKAGGLMTLCIYSGGDSGYDEKDRVLSWLQTLDPKQYLVIEMNYRNRPNDPPIPVLIVKKSSRKTKRSTENSPVGKLESTAEIRIRTVLPSDAAELLKIYAPYVEETAITFEYDVPSVEEFRNRIVHTLKRYPYLAAEENGRLVGYCYAGPFKERAAYDRSVETTVYVDRAFHRKGIGKLLYQRLEELLAEQGILNAYACIAKPKGEDPFLTDASIRFHAAEGYQSVGVFHDCGCKFNRWYDMTWMEKMLGEHIENKNE